ncbi:MAG: ABC-2 family transporter protein [Clostridia bacterium]|nr:ABC-2 family transporter protein [Clostridia bacterium]
MLLKELRVYIRCIRIHLLSGLEYKGWWFMVLHVVIVCITDPIGTILVFDRFGGSGPWTLERILLVYSLAVTSFGLAESFCRGFDYFPWHMLRTGNFDRVLLRPRTLFTQVASSAFHIHRLARATVGLILVLWSLGRLGATLTLQNTAMLALALTGGFIMYSGVFVMSSGIAIFTVRALDWIYILTNASYQANRVPKVHMPKLLKNLFTFCMPMLVISYYPASSVCGFGDARWLGWLALPAGLAFFGVSLIVWRIGVRHYTSTGS